MNRLKGLHVEKSGFWDASSDGLVELLNRRMQVGDDIRVWAVATSCQWILLCHEE